MQKYKDWLRKYKQYQEHVSPILNSKKGKAYSMLVLSFFTMAFFGFFALRPTLTIIARLQREVADSRKVDEQLTHKIEALAQAQDDYELISGAVPLLYKALPETPDVAQLLSTIERVARVSQATVSGLRIGEITLSTSSSSTVVKFSSPTTLPFSLTIEGAYEQLIRFLELLVSNPRLIKIDTLSIAPSGQSGLVSVTIQAQAEGYYLPN